MIYFLDRTWFFSLFAFCRLVVLLLLSRSHSLDPILVFVTYFVVALSHYSKSIRAFEKNQTSFFCDEDEHCVYGLEKVYTVFIWYWSGNKVEMKTSVLIMCTSLLWIIFRFSQLSFLSHKLNKIFNIHRSCTRIYIYCNSLYSILHIYEFRSMWCIAMRARAWWEKKRDCLCASVCIFHRISTIRSRSLNAISVCLCLSEEMQCHYSETFK